MPNRFPLRVDPSDAPTSSYFQPVIVHAILDANDGTVIDAEPIQNYDPELTRAAMELISNSAFPPMGFQRDVFINVQFHLPAGVAPTRIVDPHLGALAYFGSRGEGCAAETAATRDEVGAIECFS